MGAASAARAEAAAWVALARDPATSGLTEAGVVGVYDPRADLERRAGDWGYPLGAGDLADLCRFAAALAVAEAEAWQADEPHVATRAYEARRFLAGDRILHWAVPATEGAAAERLLDLGDLLRPAPALAGGEGLYPPGEDAYGPLEAEAPAGSLWSGAVGIEPTAEAYAEAVAGWRRLAAAHQGTGALWLALAARAERTAARLRSR